jgi:hypothetical protein
MNELPVNARLVRASARVIDSPVAEAVPSHQLTAQLKVAMETARPDLITDGSPTLTHMVAWLCHEGVNQNRLAFLNDDLAAAAAKITPQTPIVMDFNHSAVSMMSWDPQCIGVWYAAEHAFDPQAQDGKGAWGILARGVMFAWLYPDIADLVLAEQARNERVDFSMACIASRVEYGTDTDGAYEIAREPVFFTLSLLDVPPADRDARGSAHEAGSPDEDTMDHMRKRLMDHPEESKKCKTPASLANLAQVAAARGSNGAAVEDSLMNEELMALLAGLEDRLQQQFQQAVEALLESSRAEVAELQTQLDEATTARAALVAEAEQLTARVAELELEASNLNATLEQIEAARLEAEAAAEATRLAERLTARIAGLPEAVQVAHAARTDERKARLEAKWSAMSDEDWTEYVQDELLAGAEARTAARTVTFAERSAREGALPLGGEVNDDWSERIARIRK